MTNLETVFSRQDAESLRLTFEQSGFKKYKSQLAAQYSVALKQANTTSLNFSRESVILHLYVKAAKGCLFSLAKDVALPREDVYLHWIVLQNRQGQTLKICNHGELLITNNRIIVFTYQDSNSDKIETAWDIALHDCEYVGYEDSILNVQLKSSDTLKLNMAFPQASLAAQFSTIQTSDSHNDRMDALNAQRITREYEAKGTNAKNQFYQFFQLIIQSRNQVQIASRPPKDVLDMLENLEKLRQAGILSEAEFVAKKQELLSRL